MDLPNLFAANSEGVNKLILCIVLSDASVQSLLLGISLKGTRVVKKSTIIPYTDATNCIVKTDESLQELGTESERVNEVLFGLEQAWLSGSAISEHKKELLHKLTTELSLKPLGFVVQTEALYQHYVSHNAHASIILLVFSEQFISVVVVAQGQLKLTETVGRSQDIVSDIKEALARYTKKHESTYLPAKFVCASLVLPETELAQYQQLLLDVAWSNEIPFVQKPTVDVMRSDLAISLIAQQAGNAMAATLTQIEDPTQTKPVASGADNLGFEQLATRSFQKKETAVDDSVKSVATSFGVPIKTEMLHKPEETVHAMDEGDDDTELLEKPSWWKKLMGKQGVTFGGNAKKQYNLRTMILIGASAGIVVLAIVSAIFIFFFSQVTAVIVPKSVVVSKEVTLTIDPEAQASDPQNLIIPGKSIGKTLTKETTIQTSGVKIVGDKAKGEVLLYNKTTSEKTFPAGTVVEFESKQFVTDTDVTVPAAVVQEKQGGSQTDYGEKTVPVSAYLIGVEGNIAKDKEMTVADFDKNTYSALSTKDFTGGSSREVRVVAQADLDAALADAKKSLLEQANMEFAQESKDGIYILPTGSMTISKTQYSAELEKEAEDLTTTITAEVTALSYKVDDLKPLATAILTSEVPQGYEIDSGDPQILSEPAENLSNKDQVALSANISSTALPKLDEATIKQDIAGKPVEEALSTLQSKTGVKSASFVFYPSWARGFIKTIPSKLERITVEKIEE
jgi:hypothetical protein